MGLPELSTHPGPSFPPVFHEWFIETFPEPTAWLASRLAYGRTAAVMSMVGFILGFVVICCQSVISLKLCHIDWAIDTARIFCSIITQEMRSMSILTVSSRR